MLGWTAVDIADGHEAVEGRGVAVGGSEELGAVALAGPALARHAKGSVHENKYYGYAASPNPFNFLKRYWKRAIKNQRHANRTF